MIRIDQNADINEIYEMIKYSISIIKKHSQQKLNIELSPDIVNAYEYQAYSFS